MRQIYFNDSSSTHAPVDRTNWLICFVIVQDRSNMGAIIQLHHWKLKLRTKKKQTFKHGFIGKHMPVYGTVKTPFNLQNMKICPYLGYDLTATMVVN